MAGFKIIFIVPFPCVATNKNASYSRSYYLGAQLVIKTSLLLVILQATKGGGLGTTLTVLHARVEAWVQH